MFKRTILLLILFLKTIKILMLSSFKNHLSLLFILSLIQHLKKKILWLVPQIIYFNFILRRIL